VAIARIVWFTHLRARSGTCTSPTVSIVFSPGQVLSLLRRRPAGLGDSDRADLERLIIQDHRHHAATRAQRGSAPRQPPGRRTR
jgi:hypothetical protein